MMKISCHSKTSHLDSLWRGGRHGLGNDLLTSSTPPSWIPHFLSLRSSPPTDLASFPMVLVSEWCPIAYSHFQATYLVRCTLLQKFSNREAFSWSAWLEWSFEWEPFQDSEKVPRQIWLFSFTSRNSNLIWTSKRIPYVRNFLFNLYIFLSLVVRLSIYKT